MFDERDPNHPANVRQRLKEDRKNAAVPDRPTPVRHPADVRRQFQDAGLRGPDYRQRRRGD